MYNVDEFFKHKNHQNMPKKKRKHKGFTPEKKAEAVRLLQEGNTLKQVAGQMRCSIAALQNWKKQFAEEATVAPTRKAKYDAPKMEDVPKAEVAKPLQARVSYEKFVRRYWEARAVDVLLMEPAVSSEIVKSVNEALRYAYDSLQQ